jgi:ATP-dependent DNA ligase
MIYKPCISIIEALSSGLYLVEPKFDGIFTSIRKYKGKIEVWSRRGERKSTLEELLKGSLDKFPSDIWLLGEAEYGSQAGRIAVEKRGYPVIHIFDMVESEHEDKNIIKRKNRLNKLIIKLQEKHLEPVEHKIIQAKKIPHIFKQYIKQGYEGIIIKDIDKDFQSEEWWKQKKVLTDEFIIIGYEFGNADWHWIKNYQIPKRGVVGNIICGLWKDNKLVRIMRVGQMPFGVRLELTLHPKKYLGRVVEIKGFERFESGALRHASLVRFRNDLSAMQLKKKLNHGLTRINIDNSKESLCEQ